MKKILIVLPGCKGGGVLSSLIALLNSNFPNRYNVSVFIMNSYGETIRPEIERYFVGKNTWTSLIYANVGNYRGLLKWNLLLCKLILRLPWLGQLLRNQIETKVIRDLEKIKYDCVISFQESASLSFVAKFSNKFKIAWVHCDYSRVFTRYEKELSIFSNYSKIVTVSKFTKDVFCNLLPSLASRVEVIYNLMDYDAIIKKSREPIEDKRFATDCFIVISVGRISAVKQFNVIPQIAAKIKSRRCLFKWFIIGGVYEEMAYIDLMSAIAANDVEDVVICLGEKINPYPYFKAANILVSTSSSEACPMIFNEAKILNVPIVTNNFGSSREFVSEGIDGYICTIEEMPDIIYSMMDSDTAFQTEITSDFSEKEILLRIDNLLCNFDNEEGSKDV